MKKKKTARRAKSKASEPLAFTRRDVADHLLWYGASAEGTIPSVGSRPWKALHANNYRSSDDWISRHWTLIAFIRSEGIDEVSIKEIGAAVVARVGSHPENPLLLVPRNEEIEAQRGDSRTTKRVIDKALAMAKAVAHRGGS